MQRAYRLVMDRGTASIGSLLSYILFNIVPVFVDIGIAVLYFIFLFDWIFGLVVFLTMAIYVSIFHSTVKLILF
jgi:ATP-binding cassette subfamily B (MDR/TAP) protein 6